MDNEFEPKMQDEVETTRSWSAPTLTVVEIHEETQLYNGGAGDSNTGS